MKYTARDSWVVKAGLAIAFVLTLTVAADLGYAAKKPAKKPAKKKAPAKKKKSNGPKKQFSDSDIYAKMSFSHEQQQKFDAVQQKLQDALDAWDASAKGQRLLELQNAMEMALTPAEKSKAAGSMGTIRQLLAERNAIERRFEPQIIAVLTPQQKANRLGYKLCNRITAGKLGGVLKPDQVSKIQSTCMKAGVVIVKGAVSPARAEAQLQSYAIGLLADDQKKKLGLSVEPKRKPQPKKRNNRRRKSNNNKKARNNKQKAQAAARQRAQAAAKKKAKAPAKKK